MPAWIDGHRLIFEVSKLEDQHGDRTRQCALHALAEDNLAAARPELPRPMVKKSGRPLRKKRRRPEQRMPRLVAPAVLIDSRPPVTQLRERLGNWEGDLIVDVRSQSAVAILAGGANENTNGLVRHTCPSSRGDLQRSRQPVAASLSMSAAALLRRSP
ncbi:hypothetical protein ACGFY0_34120 [Streptomyces chartreusis]|uniref:hypothetical protein n=1 Tax=Streptomyces chartreusis TaxID=1969 RepID=UPI003714185F